MLQVAVDILHALMQGWGTCGPREHLLWPASEFLLPKLQYKIASQRSSTISRHLRLYVIRSLYPS